MTTLAFADPALRHHVAGSRLLNRNRGTRRRWTFGVVVLLLQVLTTIAADTTAAVGGVGWIRGTVTDGSGAPLAGVEVTAELNEAGLWNRSPLIVVASATTDADGGYALGPLDPEAYAVSFRHPTRTDLSSAWWDPAAPGNAGAYGVFVTTSADADRTGIDVRLPAKGAVRGTVTGPDGAPLAGVGVRLQRVSDPWSPPWPTTGPLTATTGADGAYDTGPVDLGSWFVQFVPPDGSSLAAQFADDYYPRPFAPVLFEYSRDVPPPPSRPTPRQVLVPPEGATVDARLAMGGTFEGRVRHLHGAPIGTASVAVRDFVWPCDCPLVVVTWLSVDTPLASDGRFRIGALPTSDYRLDLTDDSVATWNDLVFPLETSTETTTCDIAMCEAFRSVEVNVPTRPVHIQVAEHCDTRPYPDVATSLERCWHIRTARTDGTLAGFADGTFRPATAASRQAAIVAIWRWAGRPRIALGTTPRFSDVGVTHPHRMAIEWAAASGIATGYADGVFRPTAPVTRQALALFLWRAADRPAPQSPAPFGDLPPPGTAIATAARWVFDEAMFAGEPGSLGATFGPATTVTRAELADWFAWYAPLS